MSLTLPFPTTFAQTVWALLGIQFGRSFGKKLDQDIQASAWFKTRNPFTQGLLKRGLDCLHHWWIGALIMIYVSGDAYWFGLGLLIDDLPDVPRRFKGLLQEVQP
jgi:hypothetical protein